MPIDPSISLGVQPPPNPLATAGQAMDISNSLARNQLLQNQNQLYQLETQSKLAVGHILGEATDPDTGQIDLKKAGTLAADMAKQGSPIGAFGLANIMPTLVDKQIKQLQLGTDTQKMLNEAYKTHTQFAAATLGRTDENGNKIPVTKSAFQDALSESWANIRTNPNIPADVKAAMSARIMETASKVPDDPQGLQDYVERLALEAQPLDEQIKARLGQVQHVDAHDRIFHIGFDSLTNQPKLLGTTNKSLTPGEGSEAVTDEYGNQVPKRGTTLAPGGSSFTPGPAGSNPLTVQGGIPAQANPLVGTPATRRAAAGAPPPPGQAGNNASQAQTNAVAGATAEEDSQLGARGTVPGQGQPSGLVKPQNVATADLRKPAIEYVKNLNERVASSGQMLRQLGEVIPLLEKTQTGGLSEIKAKLASIAQGIPGVSQSLVDRIAGGDLSAAQEFDKFMVTFATTSMTNALQGNTGKFTQMEWAKFQEANPNLNTDPDAAKKIFNFMKGQYKLDKEQQDALLEARKRPDFDITGWENEWQNKMLKEGKISTQEIPVPERGAKASETVAPPVGITHRMNPTTRQPERWDTDSKKWVPGI
jgi:hypothetical protein